MGQPVKIVILDQEYLIRSDENPEQIYKVAAFVNEKLDEARDNSDGLSDKKIAILTALNIASEYFQLLNEREKISADIHRRMQKKIIEIDDVINAPQKTSPDELEI